MLFAGTAGAQEQRTLARDKFVEGRVQFAAQHYEQALQLFQEAYKLAPYPDLLFNIGRCHQQMGHFREALDAYERFLAVNPGDDDVRARAEDMRRRAADEPPPITSGEPEPSPTPAPQPSLAPITVTTPAPTPVYRKWWLWTAVVGVAAIALGVGLGVGLSGAEPQRTFPPLGAQ